MSDDGANMGVAADRALETVLGGKEQPTAEEQRTPEQAAEWLKSAEMREDFDYGEGARYAGKMVLRHFERHPEHAEANASCDYEWFDEDPVHLREAGENVQFLDGANKWFIKRGVDLMAEVEKEATAEEKERILGELTGFMWGWAVNAAKYALGKPPVANPAIVSL